MILKELKVIRNFRDKEYVKWRIAVKRRDRWRCRMPGCKYVPKGKTSSKLQVHHIKPWAQYPMLRYDVSNGITLCRECHEMVKNKEMDYEQLFSHLIVNKKQRNAFLQHKLDMRHLLDEVHGD